MPLTPFHVGPGLFIPLLFMSIIDLPTFLVASVILDFEPLLVLSLSLPYSLHGFFHSFLGGSVVVIVLIIVMAKTRKLFSPLMSPFKLEQKWSVATIAVASFLGVYLHILLDAMMHWDMQPFFPFAGNPLLDQSSLSWLMPETFCVWCFFGAAMMYSIRLASHTRKPQKKPQKNNQKSSVANGSLV